MAENGWKLLEWLEMAGIAERAGNIRKWLEMAENG